MIMDHSSSLSTGFRMEQVGIFLNNNVTFKYAPTFAILHSIEASFTIVFVVIGAMLTIPLIWIVWNAKPLHQNLRIIFAVSVMQCTAICISRSALIYTQCSDSAETSIYVFFFAIVRIQSFAFFSIIMTVISCERLVATFFSEWYEVQRPKTLLVVAGIFGAMTMYILWNTLQVIGVIRMDSIFAIREVGSPLAGFTTLLSCIIYGLLLLYNKYALRKRYLLGASSFYCLARTYQLRENVVMMEMILRIMGPAFVLCFPAFGLRALHHRLPKGPEFELYRGLSVAMFDLWISILTAIMVIIFPLYNFRFRNTAANVVFYRSIVSLYNNRKRARISSQDCAMADLYFASLNRDLSKREKQPCPTKISKYLQPDCNCKY